MKLNDGSGEYVRMDDIRPGDTVRCEDRRDRLVVAIDQGSHRGAVAIVCEDGWGEEAPAESRIIRRYPEEGDTMTIVTTAVKDIKAGDKFTGNGKVVWTALEDAILIPAREPTDYGPEWAQCRIMWSDSGTDYREWDDPNITLDVQRDTASHEQR